MFETEMTMFMAKTDVAYAKEKMELKLLRLARKAFRKGLYKTAQSLRIEAWRISGMTPGQFLDKWEELNYASKL